MRRVVCSLAVLALGVPGAMSAQGRVIEGTVVDDAGTPVPYANIIASGSTRRTAADAQGKFRLAMDSSAKPSLYARRIGYVPLQVSLEPWPDTAIRLVLAPASRTLSTITVAVERSATLAIRGFYERMTDVDRGINYGYFITPEDIETRKGSRTSDLLSGIPSVRLRMVKTGDPLIRSPQDRRGWEVQGMGSCRMEVLLDGVRLVNLVDGRGKLPHSHIFLDDIVSPSSVAGIEVYPRSVQAPPKYQSLNGMCGVVLIWTK